jgi:hypothetical protein
MTSITRPVVLAMLLVVPLRAHAERSAEAGPLAGCPPGTYRFLVSGDPKMRELDIRDGNATLLPGCQASKAQLAVAERGATVAAEWASCAGSSQRVQLEGRIHGAFCERFDGTLTSGKDTRDVHAELVGCRSQYPNESERKATVARAVSACMSDLKGDPWKNAQDFGKLYYAVQARLGCSLEN